MELRLLAKLASQHIVGTSLLLGLTKTKFLSVFCGDLQIKSENLPLSNTYKSLNSGTYVPLFMHR